MTALTITQINTAIISGGFTTDQLRSMTDAITFARAQLTNKMRFTLVTGAAVKFTSSRTGMVTTGTVKKINRKFVIVNTNTGNWRVPAHMLTAV